MNNNIILLKGFLFALVGLFVVLTLFSLFIPGNVVTTKAVPVHVSSEKILQSLTDFNQWKSWHPVFKSDSNNVIVSNPSSGVNAFLQWNSGGASNKMTITEVTNQGIRFSLTRPGETAIENSLKVLALQDSTGYQVEWSSLTKLGWYPWEKFAGIFVGDITGPGYEAALLSLQQYLERPMR